MRDTDSMTQPLVRTPVKFEDVQEGDLIVAYYDDNALQNDDAVLGGAILLRSANRRPGSWNVAYRDGGREADGLTNLSDKAHIFKISVGEWAIGYNGPWH